MLQRDVISMNLAVNLIEKSRQVAQIETMISELERSAGWLHQDVVAEQNRTGIDDPKHYAYSTCATAINGRHGNILKSVATLRQQLEVAKKAEEQARDDLEASPSYPKTPLIDINAEVSAPMGA